MQATLDCIPCVLRQALEAARFASDDVAVQERVLRAALNCAASFDFAQTPPLLTRQIHQRARAVTGVDDPYQAAKGRFNALALSLVPGLLAKVAAVADPFAAAVQVAIAGNVLDLGAQGDLDEAGASEALEEALTRPLCGDVDSLRRAVAEAGRILYLTDNAGEIVFDRVLAEYLPRERLTFAVREGPVLNDATCDDAVMAGLTEMAEVIDNGSDVPGTVLADCSTEFRRRFDQADLIIAKGQGNFESLSETRGPIWFLFKVKCPVVVAHTGLPLGAHVLVQSRATAPGSGFVSATGPRRAP